MRKEIFETNDSFPTSLCVSAVAIHINIYFESVGNEFVVFVYSDIFVLFFLIYFLYFFCPLCIPRFFFHSYDSFLSLSHSRCIFYLIVVVFSAYKAMHMRVSNRCIYIYIQRAATESV